MNNARRKHISGIKEQLESLYATIDDIKTEEGDYKDNIPENLQSSVTYEKSETACDNLDAALTSIEEAIEYLEESLE